jgi:hypothetical protein
MVHVGCSQQLAVGRADAYLQAPQAWCGVQELHVWWLLCWVPVVLGCFSSHTVIAVCSYQTIISWNMCACNSCTMSAPDL